MGKNILGKKCALLAQQELYYVNTIIGPHHKIHEKGSNMNTVGALFSNLFL